MTNKTDEIRHFLTTRSIHVCSINETWLHPSKTLNFPNYQIFRRDRQTQGGGVCLLVHNSILCEQIIFPFSQIEEILAIRIHGVTKDKQDIVVATYYNPPQATPNPAPLQHLLDAHHRVLIIGDLNAHHLLWGSRRNCQSGEAIAQLMLDADLALLNKDQATYCPVHRPEYSATLDLALASLDLASSVLSCEVSDELRSDHLSLVLEIDSSLPALASNTKTTISSIDWPEFVKQATKEADLLDQSSQPTTKEGIDIAVTNLTDAISRARAAATRTKVINLKNNKLNILPPHVVELLKRKRKALRLYQRTHLPEDRSSYNRLHALVRRAIVEHKRSSWERYCSELNTHRVSDSVLWRKLDSLNKDKPPRATKVCLTIDGVPTSEAEPVANAFSSFLDNVFSDFNSPEFDANFHAQGQCERQWRPRPRQHHQQNAQTPPSIQSTISTPPISSTHA